MASFSQNKQSKLWSVRFRIIENNKEVNKRLSGYVQKKEANAAYVDFMSTYVAPPPPNENYDLTFKQLYAKYQGHISSRLKESSIYSIDSLVENHIMPTFKECKIRKISKISILTWQDLLNKQDFAFNYKTKLRGTLSTILKFGMMYYDLPSNPVTLVESFRNTLPKKEMQVWSTEQFLTFFNSIENDTLYKTFFTFLYLTGCRKGEALSLSWGDIDFESSVLSISKTLTRKSKGTPYAISPTPKTVSSNRKILLPQQLIDILLHYKKELADSSENSFIFGGTKPLSEMTITRRLEAYCKTAKVPLIKPHDFRHSHASLLINNGESIIMVAQRLGHSDIEQTLNTYSHLMPKQEDKMVTKLNIF